MKIKNIIAVLLVTMSFALSAQNQEIKLDANKIKMYLPYLQAKLGLETPAFNTWKENNKSLYAKEMWYHSESFYIKRNYHLTGDVLDESVIAIERFESYRKDNEEAIVVLEGVRDVLVLLPKNKCLYVSPN